MRKFVYWAVLTLVFIYIGFGIVLDMGPGSVGALRTELIFIGLILVYIYCIYELWNK